MVTNTRMDHIDEDFDDIRSALEALYQAHHCPAEETCAFCTMNEQLSLRIAQRRRERAR